MAIFEIQMLTSDIIISSDGLISLLIQNGCPNFCSEVPLFIDIVKRMKEIHKIWLKI